MDGQELARETTILSFVTCGAAGAGKSTLISRLLEANPQRARGHSHRFFTTEKRKFIAADPRGHTHYTRDMITAASSADVAVLAVDARKGVLTQTKRHSFLAHTLGIRSIVLAVNKLDLVDWDEAAFDAIVADYTIFANSLGIEEVTPIPLSAFHGDNIATPSLQTPWYSGPTLLAHLENVEVGADADALQAASFRMPVQWVNRPHAHFRGFAGLIASGRVRAGDAIRVQPSGKCTTVARIVTFSGERPEAVAGESVTLTFADELDCERGDVLAAAADPVPVADQFQATLVWMGDAPLLPGRTYWLKLGAQTVSATIHPPKYQVNVNTMAHLAARTLELNAIGVVTLSTDRLIAFEPYDTNKSLGGFILIDTMTHATVAAGMIHFALRRADNVHWQALEITREHHAAIKNQRPAVLWLTGISGAGKSTLGNMVSKKLAALGRHTFLLDGDNIRHGLNRDLGFTDADRVENIRRVGEVVKLMTDAGLIVITAFISPFRAERQMVRQMMQAGEFFEIFIDTPLEHAEARDVKGLYKKARAGQLKNFTGIDSPYEPPDQPELCIDTTKMTQEQATDAIVALLMSTP